MFEPFKFVLASASPRRAELLREMDIPFELRLKPVEEDYSTEIEAEKVPEYLARKKSSFYELENPNEVLITADTLVILNGKIIGKPKDEGDALKILEELSGKTHQVITGLCLRTKNKETVFSDLSKVKFAVIKKEEIEYYIKHYKPFDKAGAYGIQDWIGMIGVQSIIGSYTNVMGLPTEKLYHKLKEFLGINSVNKNL